MRYTYSSLICTLVIVGATKRLIAVIFFFFRLFISCIWYRRNMSRKNAKRDFHKKLSRSRSAHCIFRFLFAYFTQCMLELVIRATTCLLLSVFVQSLSRDVPCDCCCGYHQVCLCLLSNKKIISLVTWSVVKYECCCSLPEVSMLVCCPIIRSFVTWSGSVTWPSLLSMFSNEMFPLSCTWPDSQNGRCCWLPGAVQWNPVLSGDNRCPRDSPRLRRVHVFVVEATFIVLGHVDKEGQGLLLHDLDRLKMAPDGLKSAGKL